MLRSTAGIVFCTAIAVIIVLAVVNQVFNDGTAAQHAKTLDAILSTLKPPAGAKEVEHEQFHKPQLAGASAKYQSAMSLAEIQEYYGRQLYAAGWVASKTGNITAWGKTTSGVYTKFCKPPYTADLEFADRANEAWTYSISLMWDSARTNCN